jgi:hypothetical protein
LSSNSFAELNDSQNMHEEEDLFKTKYSPRASNRADRKFSKRIDNNHNQKDLDH